MPLHEKTKELLSKMSSRQYYQVWCGICYRHISQQFSRPLSRNQLRRIKKDHLKETHQDLLPESSRL